MESIAESSRKAENLIQRKMLSLDASYDVRHHRRIKNKLNEVFSTAKLRSLNQVVKVRMI